MDKKLEKRIIDILEKETYIDKKDGREIGYEIFCDYSDRLGDKSLAKISKSDNPKEAFDQIMGEWTDSAMDYEYPRLLEIVEKNMNDYDEYEDEIRDWIRDYVYWYMPEDHFNTDVHVVAALDTGDRDYDFTKCNVLNYYGRSGMYTERGSVLPWTSPIRWISEQQGKLAEVCKAIELELDDYVVKYDSKKFSKFTNSIVDELSNSGSHMNTFVFLLKMPLFDFFKLRSLMADEKKKKISSKNAVTISSNAMCGLFDIWGGGGSLLEVDLEKDVELPLHLIWDAWIDCHGCRANGRGYGIDEVYGLTEKAWEGTITLPKKEEYESYI